MVEVNDGLVDLIIVHERTNLQNVSNLDLVSL